jgi:ATP synthase I chain
MPTATRSLVTANGDAPDSGKRALDPRMRTALVAVAAFGAMFAVGAGWGWGLRGAWSVAAGVAIAVLNLYGLARILSSMVGARSGDGGDAGLWGVLAVVKVCALFGGVWILMASHLVDALGLVVGWGALPVGIAIASFVSDKTDRAGAPHAKQAPPDP